MELQSFIWKKTGSGRYHLLNEIDLCLFNVPFVSNIKFKRICLAYYDGQLNKIEIDIYEMREYSLPDLMSGAQTRDQFNSKFQSLHSLASSGETCRLRDR